MDFFTPVLITGTRAALEPLTLRHLNDLAIAGADETIWRWLPTAHHQPGSMRSFIESALAAQWRRAALPFATIDLPSGKAIGSTRYHQIDTEHRRVGIGGAWIGKGPQTSRGHSEAERAQTSDAIAVLDGRRARA